MYITAELLLKNLSYNWFCTVHYQLKQFIQLHQLNNIKYIKSAHTYQFPVNLLAC